MNKLFKKVRIMSETVSGYKNISTGIAPAIIADSPKSATPNDTTEKIVAQFLWLIFGKSKLKYAAQDAISPMLVVRHASITITPKIIAPTGPK